ncbi:MAG: hypothetical protein ACHREM_12845 [Polyangiales bacterium]
MYRYVIPKVLTPEQRAVEQATGVWPVFVEEISDRDAYFAGQPQPVHRALIDFLVAEALKCSQD